MPKATDITGTFRVPEEAWGRFWNHMLTIPGADITPNTRVEPPAKRIKGSVKNGTSGKCIVLAALMHKPGGGKRTVIMTGDQLTAVLVEAGKAKSSCPNIIYELKKEKRISGTTSGYQITSAGKRYFETSCNIGES
jgi:hypothetical protein